jgi:hypothetical protein
MADHCRLKRPVHPAPPRAEFIPQTGEGNNPPMERRRFHRPAAFNGNPP